MAEEESVYDEIEIEDMEYDKTLQIYHYPCPCGDRFEIGIADLRDGADIAVCPTCSLQIRVIFEVVCSMPIIVQTANSAELRCSRKPFRKKNLPNPNNSLSLSLLKMQIEKGSVTSDTPGKIAGTKSENPPGPTNDD